MLKIYIGTYTKLFQKSLPFTPYLNLRQEIIKTNCDKYIYCWIQTSEDDRNVASITKQLRHNNHIFIALKLETDYVKVLNIVKIVSYLLSGLGFGGLNDCIFFFFFSLLVDWKLFQLSTRFCRDSWNF